MASPFFSVTHLSKGNGSPYLYLILKLWIAIAKQFSLIFMNKSCILFNLCKLLNYRPKMLKLNLKLRQYITLTLDTLTHAMVR